MTERAKYQRLANGPFSPEKPTAIFLRKTGTTGPATRYIREGEDVPPGFEVCSRNGT